MCSIVTGMCLWSVVGLTAVVGMELDINEAVDRNLVPFNRHQLKRKSYSREFKGWTWEGGSHTGGTLLALDSVIRTGNCSASIREGQSTIEYRLGLSMLCLVIPQLTLGPDQMTSLLKVGRNSVRVVASSEITPHTCRANLDLLSLDLVDSAILYSTLANYDGMNVTQDLQTKILPSINQYLDHLRPSLNSQLTRQFCQSKQHHSKNPILSHLLSLL